MYPSHLGPGDRVDLVEPPVSGPILGYSNRAVADIFGQRQLDDRRFTSRDPMPPAGQSVLLAGVPDYTYGYNNPINRVDPSGLQPECRDGDGQVAKAGECPEPWKAGSVLMRISWQYGCYCGIEPTPPRKSIPAPIDPLDNSCKAHDRCCGAATTSDQKVWCNQVFCVGAKAARDYFCKDKYKESAVKTERCIQAAKDVISIYCGGGNSFC